MLNDSQRKYDIMLCEVHCQVVCRHAWRAGIFFACKIRSRSYILSGDSTDISTDTSVDISVDTSVDTRLSIGRYAIEYRSIYRLSIDQMYQPILLSVDILGDSPILDRYFADTSPILHRYFTDISPMLHRYFTSVNTRLTRK